MNHPFKNSDFRWLLLSRILGNLSLGFAEVPLMWWVTEKTGNASLVASVALIGAVGALIAAPIGGVLADRGHRKRLIQLTLLGDALVQALMIWALVSGHLSLWVIYILVGISSLLGNLRSPAFSALQPQMLEESQYQQGNALMNLATTLGMAVSFALAGSATGLLGTATALWIGLGLLVLSMLSLLPMREPSSLTQKSQSETPVSGGLLEGLKLVRETPLLFWLFIMAALLNLILAPIGPLQAPYAKLLGGSATDYGLLSTTFFIGQLLGYGLLNFVHLKNGITSLMAGTFAMALGIGLLAVAPNLGTAYVLFAVGGLSSATLNVQAMTLLQQAVPLDKMGRVFGVLMGFNMGIQPLGLAVASALVAVVGIRTIWGIMGGLLVLAALGFWQPRVRNAFEMAVKPGAAAPSGGLQ